jgi:hypothetical protein
MPEEERRGGRGREKVRDRETSGRVLKSLEKESRKNTRWASKVKAFL